MSALIYGLVDPRTLLVRYVGMSKNGMKRPKQHGEASGLRLPTHRSAWIRAIRSIGLDYTIVALEEVASTDLLATAERFWIAYGRACGWPLTNHTDGGEGLLNPSAETRARMRASNLGQKRHPRVGRAIAARHRGRVFSAETIAKMTAANKFKRVGTKHSAKTREQMSAAQRARWAKRKQA